MQYTDSGSSPSFWANNSPSGLMIYGTTGVFTGTIGIGAHMSSPFSTSVTIR